MIQVTSCTKGWLVAICGALSMNIMAADVTAKQETAWARLPNIDQFKKVESVRLGTANRSIKKLLAVKGAQTAFSTLQPYDEAIRQLNTAGHLALIAREDLRRQRDQTQRGQRHRELSNFQHRLTSCNENQSNFRLLPMKQVVHSNRRWL